MEVQSSRKNTDTTALRANHEETDTRRVFYVLQSYHDTELVSARDTDILLLLVPHFSNANVKRSLCNQEPLRKRSKFQLLMLYTTPHQKGQ